MNNQVTPQSEYWKVLALFFKNAAQAKGLSPTQLAKRVGCAPSTLIRFFNLEFCVKLDLVLAIAHHLQLNILFETRDQSAELNKWFEEAMEQLGRRPDRLPKN